MTLQAVHCATLEQMPMPENQMLIVKVLLRSKLFEEIYTQHNCRLFDSTYMLCLTAQYQFLCMHAFW